jgi:hypothetical protein
MNLPLPGLQHRDDVEPSSAAALIENTYDSIARPSRRMRQEIAPTFDPQADDPGSTPHRSADDILPDDRNRPVEDKEGELSRKRPLAPEPDPLPQKRRKKRALKSQAHVPKSHASSSGRRFTKSRSRKLARR